MIRNIHYLYFLVIVILGGSCTKGFEDLRKSPNGVTEALPKNFLSPILYETTAWNIRQAFTVGNELMQYTVHRNNLAYIQRYDIRPTHGDNMWGRQNLHGNNIQDMLDRAEALEHPNYTAIALTLKAWLISQLTDTFGDIPYFEAFQAKGEKKNFLPKFDKQEDIYTDLLAKLDWAALLFDSSVGMDADGDLLYQGDVNKWKKFCNSLRLRLYLRVSNRPELHSIDKINEIISNPSMYPIFASNADQAYLPFSGETPYINPYHNTIAGTFTNKLASSFMVSLLQRLNDPRISAWYTKNVAEWTGVQAGFPLGAVDQFGRTSYLRSALRTSPRLGMIMSYAELQFILAEAAQKGWITGGSVEAKKYYEGGVKASMEFWGVTMPSNYLLQASVAYDDQLSTIMLQKYLSLFFVGQEAWYEYRRTGYPVLPIHEEASNNGLMPRRLLYPTTTQLYNRTNYNEAVSRIGGDNINIRCWWDN